MIERLIIPATLLREVGVRPIPRRNKHHRWVRHFSARLFADALNQTWDTNEALAAVYLSGLNHGAELAAQSKPRLTKEQGR